MTMNKIFGKLRKNNFGNYKQLVFCVTLAITLITSFAALLYSPTITNTIPPGGDTEFQVNMIFWIAIIGCLIFSVYAVGLFLKYKSRETGVFLALGTPKSKLKKALYTEMTLIVTGCVIAGIILGGISSFVVWQIFRIFLEDGDHTRYRFALTGYGVGILFSLTVFICILVMTALFMKRTNLMDILNDQRKSEPVKEVPRSYGIKGILLIVTGIALGYGVPLLTANALKIQMPAIWSVVYLLSIIGIYMVITYAVVHHERGRNPQKYYKGIISFSMMKFQGKQTVRNMCIISFLIAGSLFALFFPTQLLSARTTYMENPVDYAISYKMNTEELDIDDIYELAEQYDVEITDYKEAVFPEFIGSGVERDWDDDGGFLEDYFREYKLFDFMDAMTFQELTGEELQIPQGGYYLIKKPGQVESFFEKYNDLDLITNPITGEAIEVDFTGIVECQQLVRNGVLRYVLNDEDFNLLNQQIPEEKQIKQILFNVENLEASYEFAKQLYEEFLTRASTEMAVMATYDEIEEMRVLESEGYYGYSEPMELSSSNPDLEKYWKYYPSLKILSYNRFIQNYAVFILLFIYVAIICLAAVGIITYTRSLTIGITNKQVFEDLQKLGANNSYIKKCITKQLNKVYILPAIIGSILILGYQLLIFVVNDGIFDSGERVAFLQDIGLAIGVAAFMFLIYRVSLKKILNIINTTV